MTTTIGLSCLSLRQRGTPEEHLRYMLDRGLQYAPADGIEAAAIALLPFLNASACPRQDGECRPGACNCDGTHDALSDALDLYGRSEQGGGAVAAERRRYEAPATHVDIVGMGVYSDAGKLYKRTQPDGPDVSVTRSGESERLQTTRKAADPKADG